MNHKNSGVHVVLSLMVGFALGAWLWPATGQTSRPETVKANVRLSATEIKDGSDGEKGSRLMFSTRGENGILTEKMRVTKDGSMALGTRVPPDFGRRGGNLSIFINDPSRPGAVLMMNEHKAAEGVGSTLCFGASADPENNKKSDGWQVFLISSWLGKTRRVQQTHNRPLPDGYQSTDYPGPTSASRMEIGLRNHDWVSLAGIIEPIADDGRAYVTVDRKHPYLNMVDYLPPGGEWINNRRIGRHAWLIGTTHNTGATPGGMVLAGDSYHEYQGKGPVIKSPNGTAFRIVVDNNGKLSTEKF